MTTYFDEDQISTVPSCSCGATKGLSMLGLNCPQCGTKVKDPIDQLMSPVFWLRKPDGIVALPNPDVWTKLNKYFKKSGFNVLHYCCGVKPSVTEKPPKFLGKLLRYTQLPKSYNDFVNRFDETMEILFSIKDINTKGRREDLIEYLKVNRSKIFCEAIPLPNKILIVVEKNHMGNFADFKMTSGLSAIQALVGIDKSTHIKNKQKRLVTSLTRLFDFYTDFYTNKFQIKEGFYRQDVYGSRGNFTIRSVIVSITAPHQRDVTEVPWSHSVTVFAHHLMNKLLNEGMTRNEAVGYINECTNTYSDKIYKYLLEIQEESGDDLAALIHRNPSLLQGSSMRCRLKFKTDPKDSTIGLPLLMTGPQNADFDGDEDNVTVGLDKKMARLWNTMDMCHSYLDMFSPFSSSGLVTHSKPLTASISKFLEG
jgi:hypothetical protein